LKPETSSDFLYFSPPHLSIQN